MARRRVRRPSAPSALLIPLALALTQAAAMRPAIERADWSLELAGDRLVHVLQVSNLTAPPSSGFIDVADLALPFFLDDATLVAYDLDGLLNATVEPLQDGYTASVTLREPLFPGDHLVLALEYDVPIESVDAGGGWSFSGAADSRSGGEVRFSLLPRVPDELVRLGDRVVCRYEGSSLSLVHPVGLEPNVTLADRLRVSFAGVGGALPFRLSWSPPANATPSPSAAASATPAPSAAASATPAAPPCSVAGGATCATAEACACGGGEVCDPTSPQADERGCAHPGGGCDPTRGHTCANVTACACPEGMACGPADPRADARGCLERGCDDGVCDVDLGECSRGCGGCGWPACLSDPGCDLGAGEDCRTAPDQCACPDGWTCEPGNGRATDRGCLGAACGDGACDVEGGECAAACQDCGVDECSGDGRCSPSIGEDCRSSADCACPEGLECSEATGACQAPAGPARRLRTDVRRLAVRMARGGRETVRFELRNDGAEAEVARIGLTGDVSAMVRAERTQLEVPPSSTATVSLTASAASDAAIGNVSGSVNVWYGGSRTPLVLTLVVTVEEDGGAEGSTGAPWAASVALAAALVALVGAAAWAARRSAGGGSRLEGARGDLGPRGAAYAAGRPTYYYPQQSYYYNYRMCQERR